MDYIDKCLKRWGYKYKYLSFYKNYRVMIQFECKIHGIRNQSFNSLIKTGCFCCSKTSNSEIFIQKSKNIHGNKFDYSNVQYKNAIEVVDIICPEHGIFKIKPNSHLNGVGCKKCFNLSTDLKSFIKKATLKHDNKYDYSRVNYLGSKIKVNIICEEHGEFQQSPNSHLQGKGCPNCHRTKLSCLKKLDRNEYIKLAQKKHGFIYDYSIIDYKNINSKINILCEKHGIFNQKAGNHINKGYGCPKCTNNSVSKKEIEWLNFLNIDDSYRQKTLNVGGRNFKVDAIIDKVIYEFYGDYWHGNPNRYNPNDINKSVKKTFDELYKKTMKREKELTDCGYKVVSIWESEFEKIIYDNL
jgi:G:T-mismatch repair DNA endonuclease (very short patch repair protein)